MAYAAKRNPNRCPTHPGALLREDIVPAVGRSVAEIAGLLKVSEKAIEYHLTKSLNELRVHLKDFIT